MHINSVKVKDFQVSYDIKNINDKIQIVATFTENNKEVHRIYDINDGFFTGAKMVSKLLDNEFAKLKAEHIIEELNKSKHSPLKKTIRKMMNDKIIDIRDIDVIIVKNSMGGSVIFKKNSYLGNFVSEVVLDYLDNEIISDEVLDGLYQITIC